jgi:hypothetical protein
MPLPRTAPSWLSAASGEDHARVTDLGLRHAMFLTRVHDRVLLTGISPGAITRSTPRTA